MNTILKILYYGTVGTAIFLFSMMVLVQMGAIWQWMQ